LENLFQHRVLTFWDPLTVPDQEESQSLQGRKKKHIG
jgi:hypothetical protein